MNDLKIKIGDIISRASEVVFIPVPETGITPEVFAKIRSANEKKVEQLIIHQIPPQTFRQPQEAFEVPDEIQDLHELKMLCITGNVSSLPSCIGTMSRLSSLIVRYSRFLKSLPSSIGNLSNLTSLDLYGCSKLVSLPESIGNLSNLISLDLSRCSNLKCFPSSMQNLPHLSNVNLANCRFESIPSGIEYLKEVTELDLSGCRLLASLPESIGHLVLYHYRQILGISLN